MKRFTTFFVPLLAFSVLLAGCSKQSRLKRLLARADADFQAQRYDQAEIEYLNAVRVAPQNPIAVGRLGLIFFQQGRMPQAYGELNQAVMLDPENVEYRTKLCMTLFSACKLAE